MAKMRDKVIHSYFGIDYLTIWNVARKRFPEMKPELIKILEIIENDEDQQKLFS